MNKKIRTSTLPTSEVVCVDLNDVTCGYGKTSILKNINLKIEKGEILALLGPSGSGKTTLVKSLVGMCTPFKGSVKVLGTEMPNLDCLNKIGYMAQSDALYDDLSGLENLLFFASLYGLKGKKAKENISYLLNLVKLEEHKNKAVKNYSGGMKRRLSLAIALVHNPEVLILDEPTVGIDPLLRKDFWNEFVKLKNSGHSLIITTHVMDEARFADRIALIRDGELIAIGSLSELQAQSGKEHIEDIFLYFSIEKEDK